MFPLAYFKAEPTEYVIAFAGGTPRRQGTGLAFWYWKPTTSLVLIPTGTIDALFALNDSTGNFQPITLQGQITYRIAEPTTLAQLLNFTINPRTRAYRSDDPAKLNGRIINVVQTYTRSALQQLGLEDALRGAEPLAQSVLAQLASDPTMAALGVAPMSLFFTSIKAAPEVTRALEAEYREALQQRADQAIYARRAEAVEQERKIKQNELSTAVDLEQRRRDLVALEGTNTREQAEFAADAARIQLAPYQTLDTRLMLALAFRDFANNAHKIGNLTITADILEQALRQNVGENGSAA